MDERHSLLRRQLKQHFGDSEGFPESWREFVEAVSAAYHAFDADRAMLERSLDLSSQELLQSNSELRALFQAFPDIFFRLDTSGTILDYKGGSAADFYLPPEKLIGKRIQEIPLPGVGGRFAEGLRRVLESGRIVSLEYALIVGGRESHFEARLVPLPDAQVVVIIRNITERKLTEQALTLFRSLIDHTNDAIEVIDPETGRFLDVNEKACQALGYTREEYLALTVPEIDPLVAALSWKEVREDVRRAGHRVIESQHRRKDGSVFPVEVNCTYVALERDYMIAVVRDITERKRLEEQLRQSQKMEAVGRLAGGIAHDFNNLLTVIAGHSDLLLRRLPATPPVRWHVEQIKQSGERASSLTSQLLAFSRKQMLQPKVLDLNAIVESIEPMLRRLIGEHIRLETIMGPQLGCVMADPGQIEQVIMNLAINARDAMPQGGRLTIATANQDVRTDAGARTAAVPPGAYVTLEVSDTGVGMDAEILAHCFEPFFTTKGPGKGTGLGLATVYGIVQQSGGSLELWSKPGRGTAFTLYLPRLPQEAGPPEPVSARLDGLQGTETILLVEDEAAVRELAREILLANGYRVLDAGTPSEALTLAARHDRDIHLLLTDVVMPGMGGRTLAERLLHSRPALRVLYMSGYTDDEMFEQGVSGADAAFLSKPFTFSVLARKVREVLDRPG